jgi:hypothetical protein
MVDRASILSYMVRRGTENRSWTRYLYLSLHGLRKIKYIEKSSDISILSSTD